MVAIANPSRHEDVQQEFNSLQASVAKSGGMRERSCFLLFELQQYVPNWLSSIWTVSA
jgi:hypothetical protein